MKKIITTLLLAVIAMPMIALTNDEYKEFANQVRQEVWNKELPQFNNRSIPDKYKNESAVVIASYEEFSVSQKTKFNFLYCEKATNKHRIHLIRSLVKINDKASLDKFSTFEINTYNRSYKYEVGYDEHTTVLGVKVIKPDGTVTEISNDEYQDIEEGKKGRIKSTKLAVPNLQIGDIIDYFTYRVDKIKDTNVAPMMFIFNGSYPIIDYQLQCNIDKSFCIQYRTMNGAPDFEVGNDGKNITLSTHIQNSDKTLPDYAYNPVTQAPYIKLYITGKSESEYIPQSAKNNGLEANPSAEYIQQDSWAYWSYSNSKWILSKNAYDLINKAKTLGSDEEKADFIYNYYVMNSKIFKVPYLNSYDFASLFAYMLKRLKIPISRAITTNIYDEPMDELINYRDAVRVIMLENGKCYFPLKYAVSSDVIPSIYQGRDAIRCDRIKLFQTGPFFPFQIAGSEASDNVESVTIDATIEDGMLNISRENSHTGCTKEGVIEDFTTAEDICESWGKDYDLENYTQLLKNNLQRKTAESTAQERAELDKKNVEDNFKEEITAYHNQAPVKITQTKVTSFGNNNTPFTYNTDYQIDGLVKKAGRNLVVSIGQLFGQHAHIEGKERKREDDINYQYPRKYLYTVSLNIPSGYSITPESIKKLNNYIDNDASHFSTSAEVSNGKLIIKLQKVYKHTYEPVANWNKILDVLDKAYEFTSQQVILQKN
ncbi:MAG: DUF3857 domain-containing protein [Bacteroidaceae bacterium]|nr:DUF3857 domain-containing protein [Bacteroidaceae bacterium]